MADPDLPIIDAVVIGRNEGARLIACLTSLQGQVRRIIYVDSGSSDGSPDKARDLGAEVVDLDMSLPFTAARARNAGLAQIIAKPVGKRVFRADHNKLDMFFFATRCRSSTRTSPSRRWSTNPSGLTPACPRCLSWQND